MSTLTLPETRDAFTTNPNEVAHYADKAAITEGAVLGIPVEALCGEKFIPTRDPSKYPICHICQEICNSLRG